MRSYIDGGICKMHACMCARPGVTRSRLSVQPAIIISAKLSSVSCIFSRKVNTRLYKIRLIYYAIQRAWASDE